METYIKEYEKTKEEIDKTIGIFTEAKKAGQFRVAIDGAN